jgi:hypothetical protein
MEQPNEIVSYNYKFTFDKGQTKDFPIKIDSKDLSVVKESKDKFPEWTGLNKFKCSHCPLDPVKYKHCPLAVNLTDVIDFFSEHSSFEEAEIEVTTPERKYIKNTSIQVGVGGILGILMPTSGCPVLAPLKPLVRFHLPFASIEETEFRVFSMYLLAQYLKMRQNKNPDWDLKKLKDIYEDIKILNQNVAKQIADLEAQDTSINAVVVLNNFADYVSFSLDDDDLSDFEYLFKEFM